MLLRRLMAMRRIAFRAVSAFFDGRVPVKLKFLVAAALLLIVSPLDLLGDIPIIGIVDDAALSTLMLLWFTRAAAPYQNTIDL